MTLEFRPARREDAAVVAELCNAFERAFSDDPELESEEDILRWWRRECEAALVLDDDELVGVAYVRRRGGRWDGDGYVHPDAFGRGIGTAIAEWIEERARAHGSAETRIATLAQDERAACLLRSRGYAPLRTFFRMIIELAEQPPRPSWPDGYVVATLHPGEERDLYETLEDAFLDHWDHNARTYDEWLATQKIVHDLCFLVRAGDELAAAALCTIDDFGLGWVDILGTRREHRRRGLGEALLGQSFHTLYARGAPKVALGVDAESPTGATRLYERVGMQVASRIDLYAKML
ncbi:MAG TPA: GNAT family N-acetyltransferase [Gaiellaceae bacterium]|nr:GNAT family N-acetyltransferase [Gaiellaceae bacterium]